MRMRGHKCSKASFSVRKSSKCNFKSKAQLHKNDSFYEMNFLQCRRQIFTCLSFFAEKVILELNCTKALLWASKNTNSVFSALSKLWECEATNAQKLLSQSEKVAKCNFKSKVQLHEQLFFLMKWTVFCNAEDRFSPVWAFLQKKSF